MLFKDWLADQIRQRGWAPVDAAREVGIDESLMSRYLNGKRLPSRQTARKLAEYFGIPQAELLEMIDRQEKAPARLATSRGVDRNVEIINWDAMPPEEAAILRRVLQGALDVYDAKQRGEG